MRESLFSRFDKNTSMAAPTRFAKQTLQSIFGALGYEVRRKSNRGWNPGYIRSLTDANVIFDLGAASGTPALYDAFAGRRFVLVEPLTEYRAALEKWQSKIDCEIVPAAVGAAAGTASIEIDPRRMTMSTMCERSPLTAADSHGERRTIDVMTVDDIAAKYASTDDRIAMKIDVEGMELDVLRGATTALARTELLIVETCVARCYENDSNIHSVSEFLRSRGFELFDILFLAYHGDQPGLMWVDLLFLPNRTTA